ncbi:28 kDa heat- and acid-stable phosphoprotein-like isoform X2 [Planococcus citri]|uniref:28 kDa heat- and acid-stable phosphoprotein-like isoform X2 n=1 Tax=Planococcus citri TaxID=170843 RepID=UPI0031F83F4D
MPKSKFTNHKGRNRRFTNPDELERERLKEEKEKSWRAKNRDLPPSESEESDEEENEEGSGDESDSSDSEDGGKAKGVEGLISIENPNRIQKKAKKVTAITENDNPQLSRREREELERQRAAQHYQKLHAEGKTEEARSDLARLAIIKQQREEAARKRDMEKKEKEVAKQSKTVQVQKAIGKQ